MDTPEQFLEAWDQFLERSSWAEESLIREDADLVQAKIYVAEGRAFFARWKRFLDIPEASVPYRELLAVYDKVERVLNRAWLEALRDALQAREKVAFSALLHHGMVTTLEIGKLVPPHLREAFVKAYMGDRTDSFEPEKEYRESEDDLAAAEENARLALVRLEVDWPEKVDDTLRERWRLTDEIQKVQEWQRAVQAALQEIE